ncbi:hypothetical protein [Hymenobacter volaticus]|uniref:hypothetical protein n=1 Tax=Hymenobacter volaticus TaxID=2932254 RepID=UPI0035CC37C8
MPLPASAVTLSAATIPRYAPVLLTALGLYAVVQVLVPLRHFTYPGDVHWTEEGHHFAWHMMLRSKTGSITYRVVLPNGRIETIAPTAYLTPRQYSKLIGQPDCILQFAHFLAADYARRGLGPVQVYADSYVQLNQRPVRPIVAPTVNLAAQPRTLQPYTWITPAPPLK